MSKLLSKLSLIIYKQFNFFWILFTIISIFVALYINWGLSYNRSQNELSEIAINISNNVDGFIEDLFQEVYSLPIYGKKFTDCKSTLEHITLNSPNISGITISDNNHQLICSTLPDNVKLIFSTLNARTVLGPSYLPLFDQPIYLIQQKLGDFYISIVVVASALQNILKTDQSSSSSVVLHNTILQKNIIRIEQNTNKGNWVLSKNSEDQSPVRSPSMFAIAKLQSIDDVSVVVFENHKTVLQNLWYSNCIIGLVILLISNMLYFLVKNMFTKRYSLHGAMKIAIKNNEFYPVYQPLFHSKLKIFTGVELLLRWRNDQDHVIMPDSFISEAESTGLIIPIALQIIEIAFKESQHLLIEYPYFHLSINISAIHFTDSTFFNQYDLLAQRYNILPNQIIFEITERDLLNKNDLVFTDKMKELIHDGYSLAVDDYGTGHASINYLQHFPFNYLKIDKIFIQAIGTNAITESLNSAIIHMAKGLSLTIIAEGVETKEQVDFLINNGVQLLQGWYFSKAVSIEKLTALLKGEKNEV